MILMKDREVLNVAILSRMSSKMEVFMISLLFVVVVLALVFPARKGLLWPARVWVVNQAVMILIPLPGIN